MQTIILPAVKRFPRFRGDLPAFLVLIFLPSPSPSGLRLSGAGLVDCSAKSESSTGAPLIISAGRRRRESGRRNGVAGGSKNGTRGETAGKNRTEMQILTSKHIFSDKYILILYVLRPTQVVGRCVGINREIRFHGRQLNW